MLQKNFPAQSSFVDGDTSPDERSQTQSALIMIVEDDGDNRLMLKTLLEMRGYRISEARDGQEALIVAKDEPPDLILLDLQLPRLNGFAVTRLLRHDKGLRDVPIVIVSAHDPAKHRTLALAAGCSDYLHKPFGSHHLEEILRTLLDSTRSRSPRMMAHVPV